MPKSGEQASKGKPVGPEAGHRAVWFNAFITIKVPRVSEVSAWWEEEGFGWRELVCAGGRWYVLRALLALQGPCPWGEDSLVLCYEAPGVFGTRTQTIPLCSNHHCFLFLPSPHFLTCSASRTVPLFKVQFQHYVPQDVHVPHCSQQMLLESLLGFLFISDLM